MAGRRKDEMDIRELIRLLRMGLGNRRIAREMGVSRNTVVKYRQWAGGHGFLESESLPDVEAITRQFSGEEPGGAGAAVASHVSLVAPYREFVEQKRSEGVEKMALFGLLKERGFTGSYSSVRRFVERLEERNPEVFLRIETPAGEEAQVDFGYAGLQFDPLAQTQRRAWVFVMTLSFSRHQFTRIVFDQKVETWVDLHVRAFDAFGGVVKRVVLDNLKAGIVRAVLNDAEAQRSYRELAEHYGFLISPCRPRRPRHKGKVESGVRYVKRNALSGREFRDVDDANRHLEAWVEKVAGCRDHGTTHEAPLSRFQIERESLLPLPASRYEVSVWKQAKIHSDCHVVFDYAYYSAPHRLSGMHVWLRATASAVEMYQSHARIATHPRATRRGEWVTQRDHLPPDKLQGLLPAPVAIRAEASGVGPATSELINHMLGERPLDRLRGAQGVLRLGERFGGTRLEAACRRAVFCGEMRYQTVKMILQKGLDIQPLPDHLGSTGPVPRTAVFARIPSEILPASRN